MITGVGVDIVKIKQFEKIAANLGRFMLRVYTPREREYLKNRRTQSYAGLFAAKEAVAKAIGTGFSGYWPTDIEIRHEDSGKPYVVLHGKAKKLAKGRQIHISISHTDSDAIAFAIASGGETAE